YLVQDRQGNVRRCRQVPEDLRGQQADAQGPRQDLCGPGPARAAGAVTPTAPSPRPARMTRTKRWPVSILVDWTDAPAGCPPSAGAVRSGPARGWGVI